MRRVDVPASTGHGLAAGVEFGSENAGDGVAELAWYSRCRRDRGVRASPLASTSSIAASTALRGGLLAEMAKHHRARPDLADRVGDALAGDVGRRAVHRLEHRRVFLLGIDVGAGAMPIEPTTAGRDPTGCRRTGSSRRRRRTSPDCARNARSGYRCGNWSVLKSGYSAEIAAKRSSQYGIVWLMPFDLVAEVTCFLRVLASSKA